MKALKLIMVILFMTLLTACTAPSEDVTVSTSKNEEVIDQNVEVSETNQVSTKPEDDTKQVVIQEYDDLSTPENDIDFGLKTIKFNQNWDELTDLQKELYLCNYYSTFHEIYAETASIIQRYPDIFQNMKIKFDGTVERIVKSDAESYEILVRISTAAYHESYDAPLFYVTGAQAEKRIIQGDKISFYGIFDNVNNYTIGEMNYYIPHITVEAFSIGEYTNISYIDITTAKEIATAMFGENCTIKENDYGYLEIEIYNPSTKFKNFVLSNQGVLSMQNTYDEDNYNMSASYDVEYMPDLQSFLVITRDYKYEYDYEYDFDRFRNYSTTIEYFDKEWNRIWTRNFDNSFPDNLDYTTNNIYYTTNDKLYIINLQTGKDSFSPVMIGESEYLKKTQDGIISVPPIGKDITYFDNKGSIRWSSPLNISNSSELYFYDLYTSDSNLILLYSDGWGEIYIYRVFDRLTGNLIVEEDISIY